MLDNVIYSSLQADNFLSVPVDMYRNYQSVQIKGNSRKLPIKSFQKKLTPPPPPEKTPMSRFRDFIVGETKNQHCVVYNSFFMELVIKYR